MLVLSSEIMYSITQLKVNLIRFTHPAYSVKCISHNEVARKKTAKTVIRHGKKLEKGYLEEEVLYI